MNTPLEAREHLLERLERDLIGPIDPARPAEVLRDNPSDKYLTGILYPRQVAIPQEEDDELLVAEHDEGGGEEAAVPLSQCVRPASAGISFTVRRCDGSESPPAIAIRVIAARYVKRWVSEANPEELTEVERRGRDNVRWLRIPPPDAVVPVTLDFSEPRERPLTEHGLDGLELYLQPARSNPGLGVTAVLINSRNDQEERDLNERYSWFQTGLVVTPGPGCEFVGRPIRQEVITPDDQTAALIYREFLEFAVGHTCSAEWDATPDGRVSALRTAWLPHRTVDATSADGDVVFEPVRNHASLRPFSATWLSQAGGDELLAALALVPDAYDRWINAESGRISSLSPTLQTFAGTHRQLWVSARDRMRSTLRWLAQDANALRAFQLANAAMQTQRRWSRAQDLTWRPFQVAFQLLVLQSVLEPGNAARSIMDLLWFPTGGGKTEAYLGVIAMVLFHRRLSRPTSPDEGAGVNVIMRYTLATHQTADVLVASDYPNLTRRVLRA